MLGRGCGTTWLLKVGCVGGCDRWALYRWALYRWALYVEMYGCINGRRLFGVGEFPFVLLHCKRKGVCGLHRELWSIQGF